MEAVWMIPVHVRPVISHDGLLGGSLKDPSSGLDRFNLTDIGEVFYRTFKEKGAEVRLKNVELPFPWEMVFKFDGEPKASLRGIHVGPSTYRSIFKLIHFGDPPVVKMVKDCLSSLERDPLESPYWDDANWQLFQNIIKLSRDSIIGSNERFMERS